MLASGKLRLTARRSSKTVNPLNFFYFQQSVRFCTPNLTRFLFFLGDFNESIAKCQVLTYFIDTMADLVIKMREFTFGKWEGMIYDESKKTRDIFLDETKIGIERSNGTLALDTNFICPFELAQLLDILQNEKK